MSWLHRVRLSSIAAANRAFRRRPSWMVNFAAEETSLSDGIRVACIPTVIMLIGDWRHDPSFALAAIGAFWTCLADVGGRLQRRVLSMTLFAVLSAVLGGVSALSAGTGVAWAAIDVFVICWIAGATFALSASAYSVAVLVATASVVLVDRPMTDVHAAAEMIGRYFLGCISATVLTTLVVAARPLTPVKRALSAMFAQLSELAVELEDRVACPTGADWVAESAARRTTVRKSIESAMAATSVLAGSGRFEAMRVQGQQAIDSAERIFVCLVAVSDLTDERPRIRTGSARARRSLLALSVALRMLSIGYVRGEGDEASQTVSSRISALLARLASSFSPALALHYPAVGEAVLETHPDLAPTSDVSEASLPSRLTSGLQTMFNVQSVGFAHSVRLAVATTVTYIIVREMGVPFGYWATMATVLILQPTVASTWPRAAERVAGSALGAVLAAAIATVARTPLEIALAVFPMVCATFAVRRVNYSLYVTMLTPTFVLVSAFGAPEREFANAFARLSNNFLGCAVAVVAAVLLWPHREKANLHALLAEATRVNMTYLRAALQPHSTEGVEQRALRRAAGLASNRLEEFCRRVRFEGSSAQAPVSRALEIASILRRMVGLGARRWATSELQGQSSALFEWMGQASTSVVRCLRDSDCRRLPALPTPVDSLHPIDASIAAQVQRLGVAARDIAQHSELT